ncbi:MAG TPA: hypothetical protein PK177_05035 [Burkholderiaceae bacterium]|nr:hypothetical protein [Burkholderiaceae bacterium]
MNTTHDTRSDRMLANGFRIATLGLLGAGAAGYQPAVDVALAVGAANAALFLYRDRTPERMAIQVRLVYLVFLVIGSVPPLGFVLDTMFLGSAAVLLTGYCPLTRVLSLMPWNRQQPITRALLAKTFAVRQSHPAVACDEGWTGRPGLVG